VAVPHGGPPGVSDVWQAKDLRKGDFGSVAMIGLTGEISEVWQMKELEERRSERHRGKGLAEYRAFRRRWWLTIKQDVTIPVQ